MTRVKVCGITRAEDARLAVALGASALGFILVPGTPRYVGDRADLADLIGCAPPFVAAIGVATDPAAVDAGVLRRFAVVQHYAGAASASGFRQLAALRVRDRSVLEDIAALEDAVDGFVLDAYHPTRLGGSGATFDWSIAREAVKVTAKPIVLAGGLTPDNVAEAVAAVRPYAVDVSSGVEAEPGRKDPDRLRAFLRAVRAADAAIAG